MAHGLSCSVAREILLDQGSNPCPCIGRRILNHCATREVPGETFYRSHGLCSCCLWLPLLTLAQARASSAPDHSTCPQMVLCPWAPSCSCPSSAASQLKMCSAWWTPMGSSGSPCGQGTPAPALSSGPIRVTPCRWELRGQVGEPCETSVCEGVSLLPVPPSIPGT